MSFLDYINEAVSLGKVISTLKKNGIKSKKIKEYIINISINGSNYEEKKVKYTVYKLDNDLYLATATFSSNSTKPIKSVSISKDIKDIENYYGTEDYDISDKREKSKPDWHYEIGSSKLTEEKLLNGMNSVLGINESEKFTYSEVIKFLKKVDDTNLKLAVEAAKLNKKITKETGKASSILKAIEEFNYTGEDIDKAIDIYSNKSKKESKEW